MRKSSQTVSQRERLPGARPRNSFKTPRPDGQKGARQIENERKKRGVGLSLKLSHLLKPSRALLRSVIGTIMNYATLKSSFPRKVTVEKPSYRRRPVSRGANTNLDRHHFPSLRFPLPVSHAGVSECGNPMPPSTISAPSAVNPRAAIQGRESTRLNRLQYGGITTIRHLTGLE